MVNYGNGKVYKIINYTSDDIYVGSTCLQLSKRLSHHKEKSGESPNRKFFKFVEENGGW
jgi:predicted GIY-YIG superfamily endonuclease